ncbi:hypothetical protein PSHT_11619 [Puccinia striiformis]|uniref:SAM domain-containing protein n=1 Tax=Puccinia striiformis TaxID=27350 RepID=A0A2S4V1U0_9BASI|nr:hypothetical protein PSHT_11619 [Puccinia striiformis]
MKTCTLVQEDPKVVAQNELAFKQLKAHHAPNITQASPLENRLLERLGPSLSTILCGRFMQLTTRVSDCLTYPRCPYASIPRIRPSTFRSLATRRMLCKPRRGYRTSSTKIFTYVTGPSGNSATPAQGPSNRRAPPAPNAPESVTETGLPADSNGSPDIRDHLVAKRWFPDQRSTQDELLQQIAPYPQAFLGQTFPGQPSVFPTTPSFPGQAWPGQAFPGQAFPGQPYAHAFPQQQQTNVAHGHQPNSVHQEQNQLNPAPTLVIDGLSHLGITHWSLLQHISVEDLINAGIPLAQARAIMLAFRRYSQHLKNKSKN